MKYGKYDAHTSAKKDTTKGCGTSLGLDEAELERSNTQRIKGDEGSKEDLIGLLSTVSDEQHRNGHDGTAEVEVMRMSTLTTVNKKSPRRGQ